MLKPESLTGRTGRATQVVFRKPTFRGDGLFDYQGVLQGFDISYVNGDHYVRDFEIVGLANGSTLAVVLNDKNFDDPVDATVEYLLLRP